jgi:hypothetical protein
MKNGEREGAVRIAANRNGVGWGRDETDREVAIEGGAAGRGNVDHVAEDGAHRVNRGFERGERPRNLGLEIKSDAAGEAKRRLEPRRVGNPVRVRQDAGTLMPCFLRAREVSRRDDGGKASEESAVCLFQAVDGDEAHADGRTGGDVGDADRVRVRALGGQQRGAPTLPAGLGERLLGGPAFAAFAADENVAGLELELDDGAIGREREDVDGLQTLGVGVVEDLLDGRATAVPGDGGAHANLSEREGDLPAGAKTQQPRKIAGLSYRVDGGGRRNLIK